jgi:hypothetical protein
METSDSPNASSGARYAPPGDTDPARDEESKTEPEFIM